MEPHGTPCLILEHLESIHIHVSTDNWLITFSSDISIPLVDKGQREQYSTKKREGSFECHNPYNPWGFGFTAVASI